MSVSVGSRNEQRFPGRIRARRSRQRGETAMRPRAGQPATWILCCMHRTRRARTRRLNTQPERCGARPRHGCRIRPARLRLAAFCHSNATQTKEVHGSIFEKLSQPGAPLRNRTVDLLLTMDHQTVPVSAVEALSREKASSRWRRRAQISSHRLRFAPKNAPRNGRWLTPSGHPSAYERIFDLYPRLLLGLVWGLQSSRLLCSPGEAWS